MHNIYPYNSVFEQTLGIIRTNALPVYWDEIEGAMFLEACRINHACDNNAQKHWNERIRKHTVHALRNIAKGEEITIYYLGSHSSRAVRQERLHKKFGFLCVCRLCSLSVEQSQKSDKRLERIDTLDDLISEAAQCMSLTLQTLRYTDELVHLYEEQDSANSALARTYWDAAQIAAFNGDLARGSIFAKNAVNAWTTAYGSDSKEIHEYGALAQDLTKLGIYGRSMDWKSSVSDIPHELGPEDFEDWLWRRVDPVTRTRVDSLTSRGACELFLRFDDLPSRDGDHPYYPAQLTSAHQTHRHWCFLGEIVDVTMLRHLQLELKDVNEKAIPLQFYTEERGSELEATRVRKGNTVAVLYAQRHRFIYGNPGIRHEDPRMLKIFPVPLEKMLELSFQIQQFSTKSEDKRICHGCGKKSKSMSHCGKCSLFWYCGSACQKVGWDEKCHKSDCKLLKDSDLRRLLVCKWSAMNARVSFPLASNE